MPGSSQSIEEEFQGIPWGSSVDFVKENAKGTLQSTDYIKYFTAWNSGKDAKYFGMVFGPDTKMLTFVGRYAEKTTYYFSQDQLCLVNHRPPYTQSFDAAGYVELLKRKYKDVQDPPKEYIGNLALPQQWGVYDMRREYPYTMEWNSDNVLIRVGCKAWPGKELREIKGVIYSSKKQRAANEKALLDYAAEKKRQAEARAKPPAPPVPEIPEN